MAGAKTPSYVLTLRLQTETWQEHILEKRFEIGRRLYNACLEECLKRYKKLQHDSRYQDLAQQKPSKKEIVNLPTFEPSTDSPNMRCTLSFSQCSTTSVNTSTRIQRKRSPPERGMQ
ncbi:hypothetical protein [Saccharococcus caldoxylosilyticus]|uniref:Uncharacterized protein n=1 Tax=Saccharococcus caldoxylosilyticus TaxID=81408 RepID=A0A150LHG0_9BACL|nr:hypothetical protein [Parageobacillus caldoxylosilyticus]KYD11801.1 hypothetical protein B4119_2298 [Parageobacillus caldoxylosilyticus]